MDKNIIWVVLIIIGVVAVSMVVSTTAPAGASYHEHTYTNMISRADYLDSDTIIVYDKLSTARGLVIETCTGDPGNPCPTSNDGEGRIWLETNAAYQIPDDPGTG